jgi:hypothetical protein
MTSKAGSSRVTCITCGKEFTGLNQWKSKNHPCIAALSSLEDLRVFERDQVLDIETRGASLEARAKLERWAYEKLAPHLELSRVTKSEVLSAYDSLTPIQKHALTKRFEFTESELRWAEYELDWVKDEGRPEKIHANRLILEEDKNARLEAAKSATSHILLLRGVDPRLVQVMMGIQDKEARRIAIRELLKSLK